MNKLGLLALSSAAVAALALAPSASAQAPSSTCAPSSTIFDGYLGTTYTKLRFAQPDPQHAWVCFQVDDGLTLDQGGKVVITGYTASTPTPSDDENVNACDTPGNQVPGEHPMDGGTVGSDDPVPHQQTYLIDSYADADEAWACLKLNDLEKRFIVPFPGATPPDADLFPDAPPPAAPAPTPWPAGLPSQSCQVSAGGTHTSLLNAEVTGGNHLWLETWQPNLEQFKLCVRSQGSQNTGGALSVSTTGTPGLFPVAEPSSDTSPCVENVYSRQGNGPDLSITRSATGANPASVCVEIEGQQPQRLRFGTTGTLTTPTPSWTPDPGTPGV